MAATVTLATTTLAAPVLASDTLIKLASTAGVLRGKNLYIDGELVHVIRLDVDPWVRVRRGVGGCGAYPHASGVTAYIGDPHQFYQIDPVGRPAAATPVSPYINAQSGRVWLAEGDALPETTSNRWWQLQGATYGAGPLGVRTTTLDPTTAT